MTCQRMIVIGSTLFTMLFGAGNIIFPLILGRALGSSTPYAMVGFVLTAVLLPLLGFISIMLVKGDYILFLKDLGKIPAFIIASLCMILLGPIGAIPRCIALAHADLAWYFPSLSIWIFSILSAFILGLCTFKKSNMLEIISRFLGPLKIICLLSIALLGVLNFGQPQELNIASTQSFTRGFFSGYGTLDLLAILFFSQFIYTLLVDGQKQISNSVLLKNALIVSSIAGLLMTCVYLGFATVAVYHGAKVTSVADDTLLSALASILLGQKAGVFANITIILSCLTTAIALTASFADFLSRFILANRISYQTALLITISVSALFANFRFDGIMKTVMPPINIFYPALVIFALLHLIFVAQQKYSKIPKIAFFITLGMSFVFYFL